MSELVEQIAQFVAKWNGETVDGNTLLMADEIREKFAANNAQPVGAPASFTDEVFCDAVWRALKSDSNDLRKQQRILEAFRANSSRQTGEPFAYAFEFWANSPMGGGWCPDLDHLNPLESEAWCKKPHLVRNITPLYATPPVEAPASNEALVEDYSPEALAEGCIDFLEDRADEWMEDTGVQRMFNAMASVFEKYAPQEIMDRFREKLGVVGRQCHVEGALRVWEEISAQQRAIGRPLLGSAEDFTALRNTRSNDVVEALEWFGQHKSLELDFYDDEPDLWRVTQRVGSINDREWETLALEDTPAKAIIAAHREALSNLKGEG